MLLPLVLRHASLGVIQRIVQVLRSIRSIRRLLKKTTTTMCVCVCVCVCFDKRSNLRPADAVVVVFAVGACGAAVLAAARRRAARRPRIESSLYLSRHACLNRFFLSHNVFGQRSHATTTKRIRNIRCSYCRWARARSVITWRLRRQRKRLCSPRTLCTHSIADLLCSH
jgi:hypothetical protein